MDKAIISLILLLYSNVCMVQKSSPVEYIEEGTKLLEIFTKSSKKIQMTAILN